MGSLAIAEFNDPELQSSTAPTAVNAELRSVLYSLNNGLQTSPASEKKASPTANPPVSVRTRGAVS